jgi:hypothetical protein
MSPQELIALIGDTLTQIDRCLAKPDFPDTDPRWHQLFALRKALDDQQRDLVAAEFQQNSQNYVTITQNLAGASQRLQTVIADIQRISDTISTVTQIVGFVGQLLTMATA